MDYQTWVNVDDDEIIDYIKMNKRPEDIFSESELREWALDNGFVEEQ
jgi:hypothetical protein